MTIVEQMRTAQKVSPVLHAADKIDIDDETTANNVEGADDTQIGETDEQTMEDVGDDSEEDDDCLEIGNVDELYADL